MLSVALFGLVLICNFFDQMCFCYLHAYLLLRETSPNCGNSTNQSVSHENMEQICNLERVEVQEIPVRVCVMFDYIKNIEICYQNCGEKKATFLAII